MIVRMRTPLLAALFSLAAIARAEAQGVADPFVGTYDVTGVTTEVRTGQTRQIVGHVVLSKQGAEYRAASQLATDYPTSAGPVHADVVGTGEGRLEGKVLKGTAHTQLVLQPVPGVDTGFAYVPREVGPRLVSTWTAKLDRDGTLLVELSNRGAKGEQYGATTTKLRGTRVTMPQEKSAPPSP